MYFTISQHFGTRGCQEHHQLQVQDLKFVCDPQTEQTLIVEWVEGPTKTRQGGLTKMDRRLPQKMFATGDERCPVKLLEKLISLRPPSLKQSAPLYLRPLEKTKERCVVFNTACGNQQNQFICERTGNTGRTGLHKEAVLRTIAFVRQQYANFKKLGSLMTKLQLLQVIAMNSHYEIMQRLTCKTISILVASYQKHALPPPILQQDAFQQKNGVLLSSIQLFKLHCVH